MPFPLLRAAGSYGDRGRSDWKGSPKKDTCSRSSPKSLANQWCKWAGCWHSRHRCQLGQRPGGPKHIWAVERFSVSGVGGVKRGEEGRDEDVRS